MVESEKQSREDEIRRYFKRPLRIFGCLRDLGFDLSTSR